MSKSIPVTAFGTVPTVTFVNESLGGELVVWVFGSASEAKEAAEELKSAEHISNVSLHDACAK